MTEPTYLAGTNCHGGYEPDLATGVPSVLPHQEANVSVCGSLRN